MTIGELIKTIREKHGLNQTDFANLCYRNRDWVYLVENNSHKTSVEKKDLFYLAESLDEPLLKTIAVGMHYEELATAFKL